MGKDNNQQGENMEGMGLSFLSLGHANLKNMDVAGTGFQARQVS